VTSLLRILLLPSLLLMVGCVDLDEVVPDAVGEWCSDERDTVLSCVIDGDTIYTGSCDPDVDETLRLLGVDAPEIAHSPDPADCYGDEAHAFVHEMAAGRTATLQFDVECIDIYDRTLAWIVLDVDADDELLDVIDDTSVEDVSENEAVLSMDSDGSAQVLLNALIVRAGYAPVYDEPIANNIRYETRLYDAEAAAEEAGLGLWEACSD